MSTHCIVCFCPVQLLGHFLQTLFQAFYFRPVVDGIGAQSLQLFVGFGQLWKQQNIVYCMKLVAYVHILWCFNEHYIQAECTIYPSFV